MSNLFEHNLRLLASVNKEGHKFVTGFKESDLIIKPIKTSSGDITFDIIKGERRFCLHSKYDPLKEAQRFARQIKEGDTVVLYGFGLGYHVKEILNRVGSKGFVHVIETNPKVFRKVLKYLDLEMFLTDRRLNLVLEDNCVSVAEKLALLIKAINIEDGQLLIHRPSLDLVPEDVAPIRELLLEWQAKQDSTKRFAGLLEENIQRNLALIREIPCVSTLFKKYTNKPLLLIATGPSLDANLKYIKKYKDKFITFAVGSALAPLEKAGIKPDMAIITDPQERVYQQIEGLTVRMPLILLPSVNPKIFTCYTGPKLVAYQKGIDLVEKLALERNEELVNTGGSVITTALDIAIRMRCSPIMFIGLDLGYSSNRTHAGGTMYREIDAKKTAELIEVKNYQGESILAPPNLTSYRKWIERRIRNLSKKIEIYNLSSGGAYIEGVPFKGWHEVLEGR